MMSTSTRLFIGNLSNTVTEDEIIDTFSKFGTVENVELKSKPNFESGNGKFAFVTFGGTSSQVDICIQRFSQDKYNGSQLYVTRARESFLERLQKERTEAIGKTQPSVPPLAKDKPTVVLSDSLNPRKRSQQSSAKTMNNFPNESEELNLKPHKIAKCDQDQIPKFSDKKKLDSDQKRLESMHKMRQSFKERKSILKIGLAGVDKSSNKKIVFTDNNEYNGEQSSPQHTGKERKPAHKNTTLFEDDDDSNDEVDFQVKEQFEGKRGQKVLELQSRYKTDKRFTLDERFIEDEDSEDEKTTKLDKQNHPENYHLESGLKENGDQIDGFVNDEKIKQLNILQDVLGVAIKSYSNQPAEVKDKRKAKAKLGMFRFDPSHPEHSKFLAPTEAPLEQKKGKKKKEKDKKKEPQEVEIEIPKVEVSKETFYKVSDTLKEAMTQPSSFSLRSLFGNKEEDEKQEALQEKEYTTTKPNKEVKMKNPFDTTNRNPFRYDSSDSEEEVEDKTDKKAEVEQSFAEEKKAVWSENLFFSMQDDRFKEGLAFFNKSNMNSNKERRELKSIMKKRLYNRSRKDQMFTKKIGGKRKGQQKQRKFNKH